jgi:putative NADH-flavin reductase
MKIGIIGASGKAGNIILKESISRNHETIAIVRNKNKIDDKCNIIEKDFKEINEDDLKNLDVIINAFGSVQGKEYEHVEFGKKLINLLKNKNTRLVVVGGAGSLFVDENKTIKLYETPEFPKEYIPISINQSKNLDELEKTEDLNWTFISPSAIFDPNGEKTGKYKIGKDNLIVNKNNQSYISYSDYAIAVIDEIENPKHIKTRFCLVSE